MSLHVNLQFAVKGERLRTLVTMILVVELFMNLQRMTVHIVFVFRGEIAMLAIVDFLIWNRFSSIVMLGLHVMNVGISGHHLLKWIILPLFCAS